VDYYWCLPMQDLALINGNPRVTLSSPRLPVQAQARFEENQDRVAVQRRQAIPWALKAYMVGRGVMQGMSAANLSCEPADLSHLLRLIDAH